MKSTIKGKLLRDKIKDKKLVGHAQIDKSQVESEISSERITLQTPAFPTTKCVFGATTVFTEKHRL